MKYDCLVNFGLAATLAMAAVFATSPSTFASERDGAGNPGLVRAHGPKASATPDALTIVTLDRYLKKGKRGRQVKLLQHLLSQTGDFTYHKVTGYFGQHTADAVKRYQCRKQQMCSGSARKNGYGVVSRKTRIALCRTSITLLRQKLKDNSEGVPEDAPPHRYRHRARLVSCTRSVVQDSQVELHWAHQGMRSCSLYDQTGKELLAANKSAGSLVVEPGLASKAYYLWCNPSDGSAAIKATFTFRVEKKSYKMSDYWPVVVPGRNRIRHYDNGLVDVFFAERSRRWTFNIANYLPSGKWVSTWKMRINRRTGTVHEVGDDIAQRGATWYNPRRPIIWGTRLKIGQRQSARAATVHETVKLVDHHETIKFGRQTFHDVIELYVIQTWRGGGMEIRYFLQKGFGFVRSNVVRNYNSRRKVGAWTLVQHCTVSVPGQLRCDKKTTSLRRKRRR